MTRLKNYHTFSNWKLVILIVMLLSGFYLSAQTRLQVPFKSPNAKVEQAIGLTIVTVEYSRPSLKGRKLGEFVATYGQVWRTGANHNTTLKLSEDITFEGNALPKGTYSLFTIPGEAKWEVIISKNYEQWGAFTYNQSEDVFRVTVEPEKGAYLNDFQIYFESMTDYSATLVLHWGETRVPIQITTDTNMIVERQAATALESPPHWIVPNEFAAFANRNNTLLKQGLEWAKQSVAIEPSAVNLQYLAELQSKSGMFEDALATINKVTGVFKYPGNLAIKAEILAGLKRYKEAVEVAEEAINMDQNPLVFADVSFLRDKVQAWKKKQ